MALACCQTLPNGASMAKKKDKMAKVMGEFKHGTLQTGKPGPGKGPKVKSRKQAIAIALSEAGKARKRK